MGHGYFSTLNGEGTCQLKSKSGEGRASLRRSQEDGLGGGGIRAKQKRRRAFPMGWKEKASIDYRVRQ